MTPINSNTNKGFALLITLLIIGVVISVTMAIVELSLKQLELSVSSRDSEVAFAAANAGLECAKRTRRSASTTIEIGTATTLDCFENSTSPVSNTGSSINVTSGGSSGKVYRYQPTIDWSSADRCSEINIVAMVMNDNATDPLVISGLTSIFPGYSNNTKSCNPGGNCTIAGVRGYSAKCTEKTNLGTLMREILLEF